MKNPLLQYVLRLGDDAVVLGHRLSEWCSRAPILEEDLALTNIALDYIGRAASLLEYAAECEGQGNSADDLVYRRDERHYYNHLLVELPNGDFAQTMVRQFLFSAYDLLLCTELSGSRNERLAGIFQKAVKEAKYHRNHAANWLIRLGNGTEESHIRTQKAVDWLWPFTGDLFDMGDTDLVLLEEGIACDLHTLKQIWLRDTQQVFIEAGLKVPSDVYMHTGSRHGIHTEYLGHLLAEMQFLVRAHPTASW